MKTLRTLLIGLMTVALIVVAIVLGGRSAAHIDEYDRSCPVSGALCGSNADADVRGCHGS